MPEISVHLKKKKSFLTHVVMLCCATHKFPSVKFNVSWKRWLIANMWLTETLEVYREIKRLVSFYSPTSDNSESNLVVVTVNTV